MTTTAETPEIAPSGRDALVFSGGGILFATHVGVMAELAHWTSCGQPLLEHFPIVVGTSAGALYGALYASGLSPAQIAVYARFFTDPEIGPSLFDRNYAGAAAAFTRHDAAYALGAVRGIAIQTLLETVFSTEIHARLRDYDPVGATEADWRDLRKTLVGAWQARRRRRRGADYYRDQLNFGHCTRELFLVAVNAYNGQKTVFAHRPHQGEWEREKAEDEALYLASAPPYLNAPGKVDLRAREEDLRKQGEDFRLQFRRFENRVYRGYNTELYGAQLPLALAVRASLSIPVVFEPLRLRRWHEPSETTRDEDLFIDGGVDDNFSISVAIDPLLGNARHVLGISLGNLGYRLPDANASENVAALLSRTTSYMGDAILDLVGVSRRLADHRVTVLNALPGLRSRLTDTNLIDDLVNDGTAIARDFWTTLHGTAYPSDGVDCQWPRLFARAPEQIYLSPTARGMAPPTKPRQLDRTLRIAEVFRIPLTGLGQEWGLVYIVLALVSVGVGAALSSIIEALIEALTGHPLRGLGMLLVVLVAGIVWVLAGVLLTRLWAFGFWWNRPGRQQ